MNLYLYTKNSINKLKLSMRHPQKFNKFLDTWSRSTVLMPDSAMELDREVIFLLRVIVFNPSLSTADGNCARRITRTN